MTTIDVDAAYAALVGREAPRLYRPLSEAADDFIAQSRDANSRIRTGLDPFDDAMRGVGRKELLSIQGSAHQGKTIFLTQMIYHNRDKPIVLFTPDETRVLVLVKLVSLVTGVSAEDLEAAILAGDEDTERMVRGVATDSFPLLAVFDQAMDTGTMTRAYEEAGDALGEPRLVAYDFIGLMPGGEGEGGIPEKFDAIKAWGKEMDVPLAVLHQASRGAGADGKEQTITSGAYGGEDKATFVVGVRRKRTQWAARIRDLDERIRLSTKDTSKLEEQLDDAYRELAFHQDTITFNLVKNKRPPGRAVDEIDYILDADTGALRVDDRSRPRGGTIRRGIQMPRIEVPRPDEHGDWHDEPF